MKRLNEPWFDEAVSDARDLLALESILRGPCSTGGKHNYGLALRFLALSTNPIVRHEAAFVLGRLAAKGLAEVSECERALRIAISTDVAPIVRHEAIEALALLPWEHCEIALCEALNDKDPIVRQTAQLAVARRFIEGDHIV